MPPSSMHAYSLTCLSLPYYTADYSDSSVSDDSSHQPWAQVPCKVHHEVYYTSMYQYTCIQQSLVATKLHARKNIRNKSFLPCKLGQKKGSY
jgi:hypothetical protein